jgi:putative protein kinase ArgK-like GTPase of G3E family
MSNMLYACSIFYKTKLPMILVFNKTDVKDADFAKEWMTDYDAFQAALSEEEASDSIGGFSSAQGGTGGSGYMGSLLTSMSLMLSEFYSHLSVASVSSRVGTGIDEFFEAVQEKAVEFEQDYQPELDRRRSEREDQKKIMREKELDKMMKGMAVGGSSRNVKERENASDEDIEDQDDDDDEEEYEDDNGRDMEGGEDGLQQRYNAALGGNGDSMEPDASFAKYLYAPR